MKLPKPWQPRYFDKKVDDAGIIVWCDYVGLENRGAYWLDEDWDGDLDEVAVYMKDLRKRFLEALYEFELGM